jgi:hypothetical protein
MVNRFAFFFSFRHSRAEDKERETIRGHGDISRICEENPISLCDASQQFPKYALRIGEGPDLPPRTFIRNS